MIPPRRICVVTGSRADYGLLYWLLLLLKQDADVELQLVVTGMHLSCEFGRTVELIEKDGFSIADRIEMLLSSDSPQGLATSMGVGTIGFGQSLARLQPEVLVLLGDRFEILCAAQAAMLANIPIAHIHGGERTEGVIDEAVRHAVTKMSHLHFVATEQYARRVRQMGEADGNVFTVGTPGLDYLARIDWMDAATLATSLDFTISRPFFLVTYHPVTLKGGGQSGLDALLEALDAFPDSSVLITFPNADTYGRQLIDKLKQYSAARGEHVKVVMSLGQQRYWSAMKAADVVIGNSSSGLTEAPSLGVPSVNIGTRQQGRLRSPSVIDCDDAADAIEAAIRTALSPDFKSIASECRSSYGGPGASARIAAILKAHPLDQLVLKRFVDR